VSAGAMPGQARRGNHVRSWSGVQPEAICGNDLGRGFIGRD
jgi:hypothetical protein